MEEVNLDFNWISLRGSQRVGNRDFCGVAIKPAVSLFIVADGSTQGPRGEDLVKELVCFVIDSFISATSLDVKRIVEILRDAHSKLRRKFPADSASYIILLCHKDGVCNIIHIGDCRLGFFNGEHIEWKTETDSVASSPHSLTKSFRAREFFDPRIEEIKFCLPGCLLLSTDGFWRELPFNHQAQLLSEEFTDQVLPTDDASCLIVKRELSLKINSYSNFNNMYCPNIPLEA